MPRKLSAAVRSLIIWLFLLPILLTPTSNNNDWGDDYCQYLDQTEDLMRSNQEKPDVIHPDTYAPAHRGEGFSLLLALPYFFENTHSSYLVFISFSLILLGGVLYRYFADKADLLKGSSLPILLTLVIIYNYQVLRLKMEILPIYPFMAAVYTAHYLIGRTDRNMTLYIAFIAGLAISIANMGYALYISIVVYYFYQWLKKDGNIGVRKLVYMIFIPIITDQLIKRLVLGSWSYENLSWYENVFSFNSITQTITANLEVYCNAFLYFFEQEIWGWANILIRIAVLILFPIGLVVRWWKGWKPEDLFLFIYLFILLLYPYQNAGIRFILPIFPLILLYIAQGSITIFERMKLRIKPLVMIFFIGILLSNTINVFNLVSSRELPKAGPQTTDATDCFDYIKEHIKEGEVIAFLKPWALHYYTGKTTFPIKPDSPNIPASSDLQRNNVRYILVSTDPGDQAVYNPILAEQIRMDSSFSIVWSNECFSVFQRTNEQHSF